MTSRADEFRAKAAEAERQAEEATDPKQRDSYRRIAQLWRQMADQSEEFEKKVGLKPK